MVLKMTTDMERAVSEFVRTLIREVIAETRSAHSRESPPIEPKAEKGALLLNSREAAKALSISEPHLSRLTRSGTIPHVRVGKCLRYSVESLQNWIRQSESRDSPPLRSATTKQIVKPNFAENSKPVRKVPAKPRPKKQPKTTEATKTKHRSSAPARRKATQGTDIGERRNPFAELLAEVGIDRSSLPSLTNGELMRISETDLATYHGWAYLNRPLPEEAREKLKKHFLRIASGSSEK